MSAFKKFKDSIFNKQTLRYVCSTHFWGPVSNFGIPIAAILDLKKDPDLISGPMTFSLIGYSLVFMRYSMAVTPKNYLLLGCHIVNETAQLCQGYRWTKHHYIDEKKSSDIKAGIEQDIKSASEDVKDKLKHAGDNVKDSVDSSIDAIKSKGSDLKSQAKTLGQDLKNDIKVDSQKLKDDAKKYGEELKKFTEDKKNQASQTLENLKSDTSDKFIEVENDAKKYYKKASEDIENFVKSDGKK